LAPGGIVVADTTLTHNVYPETCPAALTFVPPLLTVGTTTAPGQIALTNGTKTVTLQSSTLGASRTYTIPDGGGNSKVGLTTGPLTSGNVTKFDVNGNIVDGGTAASSLVTGSSGTANTVPKYTGSSTLGNSSITDDGTNVGLTEQIKVKRISVANGTAQSSGNFTLSAGWLGSTVGSIAGTDQAMQFVVTTPASGTLNSGQTITITFADGAWTNIRSVSKRTKRSPVLGQVS